MVKLTADKGERPVWERENMRIRMDIGAYMAATGKTLPDLAALVGIGRGTMYNRFKNPGELSLDEVRRLYRVIGKALEMSA